MSAHDARLTAYFGERDRAAGGRFASDALLDAFERHGAQVAVLLRGSGGFGAHHRVHSDRLLSASEDLPAIVACADARERIEALAAEAAALVPHAVLTLEHTTEAAEGDVQLTLYAGRHDRIDGEPARLAVPALLQRHGVAGATVLLGVDGLLHGTRRRARFFGANADVPLVVVAVGEADAIGQAQAELGARLPDAVTTLEQVVICRRDGRALAEPTLPFHRITVIASEQARHAGHPLHVELLARLRAEGAAGATTVRGVWGYHGDHAPHGDRFWALRRHVPIVTTVLDDADRSARWLEIAAEVTDRAGLVTVAASPFAHAPQRADDATR